MQLQFPRCAKLGVVTIQTSLFRPATALTIWPPPWSPDGKPNKDLPTADVEGFAVTSFFFPDLLT
jgi:hypothetical protein